MNDDHDNAADDREMLARLQADDGDKPVVQFVKESAGMLVPKVWLDEYAGFNEHMRKVLTGEIKLAPRPEPKWHRCLWCWLAERFGKHDRCVHGFIQSDCYNCE